MCHRQRTAVRKHTAGQQREMAVVGLRKAAVVRYWSYSCSLFECIECAGSSARSRELSWLRRLSGCSSACQAARCMQLNVGEACV